MFQSFGRRALLAGSLAVAGSAAVGCSGGTPTSAPTDDSKPLNIPAQTPLEEIPGAHISQTRGVAPAYEQWPESARKSVAQAPGSGDALRTLAPTWSTAPPPVSKNQWAQQVQKDLNVQWDPAVVADYSQVISTTLASGDLPDLIWVEWTSNPSVLQALQQGAFADLTPYLAGEAIKDYPNLANLPTYAWEVSSLYKKLWIVPNTLSMVNQFDVWRADWVADLGYSDSLESSDEFLELCKEITATKPGGRDCFAITTMDRGTALAREMYGVVSEWSESGGKFTHMIETDAYADALGWAAEAWKAGVFHPDALSMEWVKERDLWAAGKAFTTLASLDLFFGNGKTGMRGTLAKIDPDARGEHFIPPAATDQGVNLLGSSAGFWGGAAIPADFQDDDKKMAELLSILDYWAAPFGTEEFLLMRYGIEGRHFTFEQGQPQPVDTPGVLEELNMNVMCAPPFQYYPANPPTAVEAQQIIEQNLEHITPNASWGLISDTWMKKSAALGNIVKDTERKIVTGEQPVTSLQSAVEEWRKAGGDQARTEFEKAFAENNGG